MLALLQSFTAVLDEFGVSNGRAKRAALCAGEGLLIAGPILKDFSPIASTEIINAIQSYNDTMASQKWLVAPLSTIHSDSVSHENSIEVCVLLLCRTCL